MTRKKYLSTQRLALVTIEERQAIHFAVPVELGVILFWFLMSRRARLVALVAWWLIGRVVKRYQGLRTFLARCQGDIVLGWTVLIELVTDLLTIQVAHSFG